MNFKMDNINSMLLFAAVVETQSFSRAAQNLGIGKSAVSMQIGRLEERLGIKLLNRTTRQLSLTEAGKVYYQSCARIAEEARFAHDQIKQLTDEVSGTLRLTCPVGFGNRVLIPAVSAFLQRYPALRLDIDLNDDSINLTEKGMDLAIRIAELSDSSLIARPLAQAPLVLVAAPDYLNRNGTPTALNELEQHQWVLFSHVPEVLHYDYQGQSFTIHTQGRVKVNNEAARLNLVLSGQGLGLMPIYDAWQALEQGSLVRLFSAIPLPHAPISALYQDRKFLPIKITVFLDYLHDHMQQQPWLQA